jgi:hypothetical protein
VKPDERAFLLLLAASGGRPRDLAEADAAGVPESYKRACYLLLKWTRRGWYNYGTSLDRGWLTEAGKEAARQEQGRVPG